MQVLREKDANREWLAGKKVAVIGFGSQGRAQALCLRDSGVEVILGLRSGGQSWQAAEEAGFPVMRVPEAVQAGEVVHLLIPDEEQGGVFAREIRPAWQVGKTLSFSHGFGVHFGGIEPPPGSDVILVAPKGPGSEVRRTYLEGFGVPGLIAVAADATGGARQTALALASALGLTRAGVLETSFREETCEDLFGEQAVLCGGLLSLMKAGFEVLTEAGYPPEMAYFETVHELKLIVDLVYSGGVGKMAEIISNTAEWGMYRSGPRIIGPEVKEKMRAVLKEIEAGSFARGWLAEHNGGAGELQAARTALRAHPLEQTGEALRRLFERTP